MASVFDSGAIASRIKQDRLVFNATKSEWDAGFDAGYNAAIERYIALNAKRGEVAKKE